MVDKHWVGDMRWSKILQEQHRKLERSTSKPPLVLVVVSMIRMK